MLNMKALCTLIATWLLLTQCSCFQLLAKAPTRVSGPSQTSGLFASTIDGETEVSLATKPTDSKPNIVLIAGFESFSREVYIQAARNLDIHLDVFADSDIRIPPSMRSNPDEDAINPTFAKALDQADAICVSLIFDYDDVHALLPLLDRIDGPRLVFESATELMALNRVGTFTMAPKSDGSSAGPPPAIKGILSMFGSGKEEDKLNGYIKMMKYGPDLLKLVPGNNPKIQDLRVWLEAYRFWNQGGSENVKSMLRLLGKICQLNIGYQDAPPASGKNRSLLLQKLPKVRITPDQGLVHPLLIEARGDSGTPYMESPREYMEWRLSRECEELAKTHTFELAPPTAPTVAILLHRKHVVLELHHLMDLISIVEGQGIIPVPIFINGVEAHTMVRDWLTSATEMRGIKEGRWKHPNTFQPAKAISVDAIVNTVGFPLVGGPAGSMEAGRNVEISQDLLTRMNMPYIVAAPLLLQSIPEWRAKGVLGLQSVVLYSLPELDGSIDSVVLGGLVHSQPGKGRSSTDNISLVPERVRRLTGRLHGWINLRQTQPSERRIALSLYGFPPNVGAVGTAALLDVPQSLENLLSRLQAEGYYLGEAWNVSNGDSSGESLVAALAILSEASVISGGVDNMQAAIEAKMQRAKNGDPTVCSALALPDGGLGGAKVVGRNVPWEELELWMGRYMCKKVKRAWSRASGLPGTSRKNEYVVAGLQLGNVWIFVQPPMGIEGDPMRLLFERDLTPHPQYCASYHFLRQAKDRNGFGAQAVVHFGMHGTLEWLPGQPLGNDRQSWSDELVGDLPNLYVYAANNPSESILAKRRGYGTIVSHNVPPYGRSGLYLELANLKDSVDEYQNAAENTANHDIDLLHDIKDMADRTGMTRDVPIKPQSEPKSSSSKAVKDDFSALTLDEASDWIGRLREYLVLLQDRLFSSGLHVFGDEPSDEELASYLKAHFGEDLSDEDCLQAISLSKDSSQQRLMEPATKSLLGIFDMNDTESEDNIITKARSVAALLLRSTEEMDSVINGLAGGYIKAAPGGDLIRDGASVLPTGRNIHSLDPYRMPSANAWRRGERIAQKLIQQHLEANGGEYPETMAVTLWGMDAIKTRGESVAIALALVGAIPVREGTGRVVRFDLLPLETLGRPRIDVLGSLSGIFRDSFANIVDLLDDMFERASRADEPIEMNFIKKHATELVESGVTERPGARLFSNPPGEYGSMVNELVGTGDWDDAETLGKTWKTRNVFSYGRNEKEHSGSARPKVLEKLLATTERVVQEVDSIEYGITDIQEYYANTGALKQAAESSFEANPDSAKQSRKVQISVVEAFGQSSIDEDDPLVKDVEEVLRVEYRTKLLNPKWRDAMVKQGSGGAYEISQRLTAMIGWAATSEVDNFVFDQAAERYALDDSIATTLQRSNPEAFKNIVRRLLEAEGRGMWDTDETTVNRLRDIYMDADDIVEQGSSGKLSA